MGKPYQHLTDPEKNKLKDYIKNNPSKTYSEFRKDLNVQISDAYYYYVRRDIHGKSKSPKASKQKTEKIFRSYSRHISPLYMTIWTYPTEKTTPQTIEVLKNLIDSLNKIKRTRWDIVELKDPSVIEIRERSK